MSTMNKMSQQHFSSYNDMIGAMVRKDFVFLKKKCHCFIKLNVFPHSSELIL